MYVANREQMIKFNELVQHLQDGHYLSSEDGQNIQYASSYYQKTTAYFLNLLPSYKENLNNALLSLFEEQIRPLIILLYSTDKDLNTQKLVQLEQFQQWKKSVDVSTFIQTRMDSALADLEIHLSPEQTTQLRNAHKILDCAFLACEIFAQIFSTIDSTTITHEGYEGRYVGEILTWGNSRFPGQFPRGTGQFFPNEKTGSMTIRYDNEDYHITKVSGRFTLPNCIVPTLAGNFDTVVECPEVDCDTKEGRKFHIINLGSHDQQIEPAKNKYPKSAKN